MAVTDPARADTAPRRPGKATETLSQFAARVLDQLSLGAWLPSAALVLLAAFVVNLGSVLDQKAQPAQVSAAVAEALGRMTRVTIGGAVLVLAAVVVLTMLTQAFAFEAIRTLEGYWGTWRPVELVADVCCGWHGGRRRWLEKRHRHLTECAWWSARTNLENREAKRREDQLDPDLTPDMIEVLEASVLRRTPLVTLNDRTTQLKALQTPWEKYANPRLMRRRINVATRLRDFPDEERVLPTRLGNVLRRHEDMTRERQLESFVERVFDDLPYSMQVAHDDQRNRLDLYCSMVFVLALVGAVAVIRLWKHRVYAGGAALITVGAIWLMYRAALASARAYGGILITIAHYVHQHYPVPVKVPTATAPAEPQANEPEKNEQQGTQVRQPKRQNRPRRRG